MHVYKFKSFLSDNDDLSLSSSLMMIISYPDPSNKLHACVSYLVSGHILGLDMIGITQNVTKSVLLIPRSCNLNAWYDKNVEMCVQMSSKLYFVNGPMAPDHYEFVMSVSLISWVCCVKWFFVYTFIILNVSMLLMEKFIKNF